MWSITVAQEAKMEGANDPKRVVARFVDEVINEGRSESMDELVAEAELREGIAWFKAAFPDHRLRIEKLLAAEDDQRRGAIHRVRHAPRLSRRRPEEQ
jgi:hypothetical protein